MNKSINWKHREQNIHDSHSNYLHGEMIALNEEKKIQNIKQFQVKETGDKAQLYLLFLSRFHKEAKKISKGGYKKTTSEKTKSKD